MKPDLVDRCLSFVALPMAQVSTLGGRLRALLAARDRRPVGARAARRGLLVGMVCVAALAALRGVREATDTSATLVGPPPGPALASQTVAGVTARLYASRWQKRNAPADPFEKDLVLTYGLPTPVSANCHVYGPSGEELIGQQDGGAGGTETTLPLKGINPNWPRITLALDVLDPKAPAGADGTLPAATLDVPNFPCRRWGRSSRRAAPGTRRRAAR